MKGQYGKHVRSILLLLLILGSIPFCAPVKNKEISKDGKTYGTTRGSFRGRWWNYYERGISFAEGRLSNEAKEDFREAIKQRRDDGRRARTYGMHFVDYFPHRELGRVLYNEGLFQEAIKELEASLSTQKSAKAKFYLNKARKALLHKKKTDETPPKIVIHTPQDRIWTNKSSILVSGRIRDKGYVASILIGGVPEFIELAEKNLDFKKIVPLEPGQNLIRVETEDLIGNRAEMTLTIHGDFKGPQISIINYMNGQKIKDDVVNLTLFFTDASGVSSVSLGDGEKYPKGAREGKITWSLKLEKGLNRIPVTAKDLAGNVTRGSIELICETETLLASADQLGRNFFQETGSSAPWVCDAGYAGHAEYIDKKTVKPQLRLMGLLKNLPENEPLTFMTRKKNRRFFLEGQASDKDGMASISINGQPVPFHPGKEVVFNQLVDLKEGRNTLNIEAEDTKGNAISREIIINRKIQTIDLTASRLSFSIMPFKRQVLSPALADSVYNLFVDEIIDKERFNVVGRGIELEAILKELQLSQTDLVDKEKAVQTGRLLGSETIMIGTIIEQENSVEVFAKLIDTETSRVMAAHDVFDMNKGRIRLEYLMEGLATKFIYSLPLLNGNILAVKGNKFYTDMGKEKAPNIKDGTKCIAYRSEPFVVNGQVLGEETRILGTLMLTGIQERFSVANLSRVYGNESRQSVEILKGDKVITK